MALRLITGQKNAIDLHDFSHNLRNVLPPCHPTKPSSFLPLTPILSGFRFQVGLRWGNGCFFLLGSLMGSAHALSGMSILSSSGESVVSPVLVRRSDTQV